jgi:hypothetical protein
MLAGNQSIDKGLNLKILLWILMSTITMLSVLMELPLENVIPHVLECICVGFNYAWDQFVQFW